MISRMATRVLWLDGGRVRRYGETDEVLEEYLERSHERLDQHQPEIGKGPGMADAVSAQEITITRVFDAPRELAWRAWTEPERLARWWGQRGWATPREMITMDVRPGGTFRLTMVNNEDGSEMIAEGVYREVVEPERLVVEGPAKDAWHEGAVSAVTFTDLGDARTEVVLHATIRMPVEMRGAAETELASSLDRVAEHLA